MAHPVPSAPKRTPLTASMAHAQAQVSPGHHTLPTVEEVSAGGVVIDITDPALPVAIIARYNRGGRLEWCLPKGHPEGLESNEEAAVREIEEETGIAGHVLAPLGSVDYWFTVSSYRVHKTVHHYLLRATGGNLTIENDPDHEAVDVAWVPIAELGKRLSFPNERRIAELAREVLPHHVPGF
ncbi:NUDIX hydrolase [Paeniglutamicibacter cryotolerans]|uniref:8-oxo-dGTP pyrophosphatase MutT (NUDIX family) n=1 Tax=Paeniglutamicibacter cryotolerans TaxID=670079 RepID=A0A839QJK0_9MICC|nr:NUDIX hydrolase [Paeniglutamicibacter cryotolerans]MBB2994914.1 8-oxo-dGTP pyrophosphatase MutT (NUDIX family) [Paeniglutamicibacter cryotolerans]